MATGDGAAQRLRRSLNNLGGSLCAGCFVYHRAPLLRVDHRIALFLGGHDLEDNVQLLCVPCHNAKTRAEKSTTRLTT